MKRILLVVSGLVGLAVVLAGAGLLWAHLAIRAERPALPAPAEIGPALTSDPEAPVRLSWTNSASQDMPRSLVLDPTLDPDPGESHRMSHPSFVLEWPDGRILLVDVGMTPGGARAFGGPGELVGAAEIEPHEPAAAALGPRARDVAGVVFSHLHTDHVEGVSALCAGRSGRLPVFATPAQLERANYTTRPGLDLLREADCVDLVPLSGEGPLLEVPGFPGVRVIAAGGHTPGSQIVAARVGTGGASETYVFTGDLVNARDGIRYGLPKPWLYSLLVVPEDGERLEVLRDFLHELGAEHGATLLVPHDERAIEEAGVPRFGTAG